MDKEQTDAQTLLYLRSDMSREVQNAAANWTRTAENLITGLQQDVENLKPMVESGMAADRYSHPWERTNSAAKLVEYATEIVERREASKRIDYTVRKLLGETKDDPGRWSRVEAEAVS